MSILTNILKIYEQLLYNQLSKYFDSLLATNQCVFRKGFSSRYCILVMLENFKEAMDSENQFGAVLTELSKAFDCIDPKRLMAKLYEYRLSSPAWNTVSSYLKHRTQWTKILSTLLFIINMIDLFLWMQRKCIANYTDDTSPYSCGTDIPTIIF